MGPRQGRWVIGVTIWLSSLRTFSSACLGYDAALPRQLGQFATKIASIADSRQTLQPVIPVPRQTSVPLIRKSKTEATSIFVFFPLLTEGFFRDPPSPLVRHARQMAEPCCGSCSIHDAIWHVVEWKLAAKRDLQIYTAVNDEFGDLLSRQDALILGLSTHWDHHHQADRDCTKDLHRVSPYGLPRAFYEPAETLDFIAKENVFPRNSA